MKTTSQLRLASNFKLLDSNAGLPVLASGDKAKDKQETERLTAEIGAMQTLLYATQKRSLLVILQGMDTAGKDRCIGSSFAQCNLMGVRAVAFKAPTAIELSHDFLWRIHAQVPARGQIVVFNRSHYEDVLVPPVHGWIKAEECTKRYQQITAFENLLAENGCAIIKIFLHISRDEQTARLKARLQDPGKQWKFDPKDLEERPYWEAYQKAYQEAMLATDSDSAPWYVVPANSKTQRNLLVASLIHETLLGLQLSFPAFRSDLASIKIE